MEVNNYPIFEPQGFSQTIFKDRYALTEEETYQEMCHRVAQQMALAEIPAKMKFYEDKFYNILVRNLFVPGGRILYYSGRKNPQLLNCFVLLDQLDSRQGWGNIAKEMIITSMTGGGCGIEYSDVRPNGAPINGTRGICPGPISLMELVNGCAAPVRSGGSRRVALMFSLDLQHPDIEEFLDAKLEQGKLTFANVSVRSRNTIDFIDAIRNNKTFELSWKGQFKKEISARNIWNKIVKNAYDCAEPGFLNWELVSAENNLWYCTPLVTTNPCGEIPLPSYGCCDLGHLVLSRFVVNEEVDFESLAIVIRLAVRFLDNVLSVNSYPLPEMKERADKERRIGLGVTGLADMLVLLGLKYGSPEALQFIDKLYRFISKQAYEASVMLSIEKGSFPLFDPEKFLQSGYMKRMTSKIRSLVSEHGIRNCNLLTVTPTGTVSLLSDCCSSGIEPIFSSCYRKYFFRGDERLSEIVFHPLFSKFMKEGKDVSSFVTSRDLTVREHMEMQKVVQKHVDQSVSKTINIPETYPMDDVAEAWLEYLPSLKGTTFYRENSRGYIDKDGNVLEPPLVALSLEEAITQFKKSDENIILRTEADCETCEI